MFFICFGKSHLIPMLDLINFHTEESLWRRVSIANFDGLNSFCPLELKQFGKYFIVNDVELIESHRDNSSVTRRKKISNRNLWDTKQWEKCPFYFENEKENRPSENDHLVQSISFLYFVLTSTRFICLVISLFICVRSSFRWMVLNWIIPTIPIDDEYDQIKILISFIDLLKTSKENSFDCSLI